MGDKFLPDFLSRPVDAERVLLPVTPVGNLSDKYVKRGIFNNWRVDSAELSAKKSQSTKWDNNE